MTSRQSVGVYRRPAFPDAVKWSEDNLLAVAAGSTAVILNPADLAGPRAFVAGEEADWEATEVGAVPRSGDSNVHFRLLQPRRVLGGGDKQKPTVRSVSWSPAGCTSAGGCLLATVTDDHKVTAPVLFLHPGRSNPCPACHPAL